MRQTDGRFMPGHSGNPNGRPKGSKHQLSEALLGDLVTHWKQHGMDAIERTFDDEDVANEGTEETLALLEDSQKHLLEAEELFRQQLACTVSTKRILGAVGQAFYPPDEGA